MLESFLWILGIGFFGGQIARRLKLPALVGMVVVGMVLGPQLGNVIAPGVLAAAGSLRTIAVMVILMKAGLGLDREKLAQQGSVALRLGFLPAICEAIAIALGAQWLFGLNFPTGLLLGCIIGAESPAVIVPGMLRLKSLGWGVQKGIPDAILTGSALSDVLLLLVFSLLLAFLSQGSSLNAVQLLPVQVLLQILLGLLVGWVAAKILVSLLTRQNWAQNTAQTTLVTASGALWLVVGAEKLPIFSGYLAVMALGFFLIEQDAVLARRLRGGFDSLWTIAEILLFVLLGASIEFSVLAEIWQPGLLLLGIGTLIGRSLGWFLSTLGSNWTGRERWFLLAGNSAKATVQAAIGGIPLAQGLPGGEVILAIAALSILVTAPLGAWAIPTFAPKLLERGEVDPTKVSCDRPVRILVAVDRSPLAIPVLKKAAELARRQDAQVIVLHMVVSHGGDEDLSPLKQQIRTILADIPHQFMVQEGAIAETILSTAQHYQVDEIMVGKRGHRPWPTLLLGSVSQTVLESSSIPVLVVEDPQIFSESRF